MAVVLLSHRLYEDGMEILEKNAETIVADNSDLHAVLSDLQKADGLILRVGKIGRDIIEACPNLKVISRPGVGVDNVDMEAATEYGIPVIIAPGMNKRSVAEHAVALTYTLTKNVFESHKETAKGNFNIRNKYAAIELENHNVGIIGLGNIGAETAKIFLGNGMRVFAYDPYVSTEKMEALGCIRVEQLHELLSICDVISLHVPATPETKNLLDEAAFSAMKDGIFVVNCARGDVVDEQALYNALKSGKVAGAASDVLQSEPMDPESPLFTLQNFIATPHMAALTKESASRTSKMTVEGTLAVIRGEQWPHVANPDVYQHPRWSQK